MANFTNQPINSTYQRVLQIDENQIQNGLGQSVSATIDSLTATNGLTGSLLGTASYATQALSASWAPGGGSSTPTFPYTGSAIITGSLRVQGPLTTSVTITGSTSIQLSSNGVVYDEFTVKGINNLPLIKAGFTGNIAVGWNAGGITPLNFDVGNVAIGTMALSSVTASAITGRYNTAVGNTAMTSFVYGDQNVAIGDGAMGSMITASGNVAVGAQTLGGVVEYGGQTAIGIAALGQLSNSNGSNTAVGNNAGGFAYDGGNYSSLISSSNGVFIGDYTTPLNDNSSYEIVIGSNAFGNGDNTATLGVGELYLGSQPGEGIILTAPNGNRYKITVSNTGVLTTTAV